MYREVAALVPSTLHVLSQLALKTALPSGCHHHPAGDWRLRATAPGPTARQVGSGGEPRLTKSTAYTLEHCLTASQSKDKQTGQELVCPFVCSGHHLKEEGCSGLGETGASPSPGLSGPQAWAMRGEVSTGYIV